MRLAQSRVAVIGMGALGCVVADQLVRAGVGSIVIVDRDIVELTNLQRQVLFSESDVGKTKAHAAAARLSAVNSSVTIDPIATDVTGHNIAELVHDVSLLIDGTDNFEARYLMNDFVVSAGLPLIYGGALGTRAMAMPCNLRTITIDAGQSLRGPCLRCVFPEPPVPGSQGTCDTTGVLGGAVAVTGGLQASMAIRALCDVTFIPALIECDVWTGATRTFYPSRDDQCECCTHKKFTYLTAQTIDDSLRLCGGETYQVWPRAKRDMRLDLAKLQSAMPASVLQAGMLKCVLERGEELMLFADGRALVRRVETPERARTLYARYVGM